MNILLKTVSGVLLCAVAANALAAEGTATDGELGTTSTGTVPVALTMPAVVKISGLTNFSFTYDSNVSGGLTGQQNFCVYTNNVSTEYGISITSNTPSGSGFQLSDNGKTVAYSVLYAPTMDATTGFITMSPGKMENGTGANATLLNCGDASKYVATLKVDIPEANLEAVPQGTYNDVLTLTVTAK